MCQLKPFKAGGRWDGKRGNRRYLPQIVPTQTLQSGRQVEEREQEIFAADYMCQLKPNVASRTHRFKIMTIGMI
jgi:hypothetical protein